MTTERIERDQAAPSGGRNAARVDGAGSADRIRHGYAPPRLRALGSAADLLEILGPAQANYQGP